MGNHTFRVGLMQYNLHSDITTPTRRVAVQCNPVGMALMCYSIKLFHSLGSIEYTPPYDHHLHGPYELR